MWMSAKPCSGSYTGRWTESTFWLRCCNVLLLLCFEIHLFISPQSTRPLWQLQQSHAVSGPWKYLGFLFSGFCIALLNTSKDHPGRVMLTWETPTQVVSGWFSAHPGPSLLAWYWRPPEVEKVHFPCSALGRGKFAFFQVYTSTNNNLMSLTLLALTWGRAGRCAPCHRAALCHEELTNSLCSAGCDWNTLLQLQAGTWQPEVVAAQSFHRILFYL